MHRTPRNLAVAALALMVLSLAVAPRALAGSGGATLTVPYGNCGEWSRWFPDSASFARYGHAMVFDANANRLVVLGGFDDAGALRNDVWTLNFTGTPTWTRLATAGTSPPGFPGATAILDAPRNRIVVFGGQTSIEGQATDRVYALSLGATPTWSNVTPPGLSPGKRFHHTAVYDGGRDRMVMFGGLNPGGNAFGGEYYANDVWALSLGAGSAWTRLTPAGTAPFRRASTSAVYDAATDRMIVFGGEVSYAGTYFDAYENDTWSLSFAGAGTWTQLVPAGTWPVRRQGHTAVLDPVRRRMILFGGAFLRPDFFTDNLSDVWALDLGGSTSWTQVAAGGEDLPGTWLHAAVYDPPRRRMVAFGGSGDAGDQAWSLSLDAPETWAVFDAQGLWPRPRALTSLVVDAPRQRVILFGGSGATGVFGDVWARPITPGGTWTRLHPAGEHLLRQGHLAGYDAARERLVVFGGENDQLDDSGYNTPTNEVWALSLGGAPAWSLVPAASTPPAPRMMAAGAIDAGRDRLLVFGGSDNTVGFYTDLWAFDFASATWTSLVPGGTPPNPWAGPKAVYDDVDDALVVIGQVDIGGPVVTWRLPFAPGGVWAQLAPAGSAPALNVQSNAVFEHARHRALSFDGGETYALNLDGSTEWSTLGALGTRPTTPRYGHGVAYDPATERLLVLAGSSPTTGRYGDLWALGLRADLHDLRADAVPPAGGTVSRSTSESCMPQGTQVTLTATPAAGYVFAGWSGDASGATNPLVVTMDVDKVIHGNFVLAGYTCNSWGPLNAANGTMPLISPGVARDVAGNRLLAFGYHPVDRTPQVWQLPLGDDAATWSRLTTAGVGPAAGLNLARVVYDPVRRRMIVYGGQNASSESPPGQIHGDLWALSLIGTPTWSLLVPEASAPPARWLATLVYDPVRDRVLLFGGSVVAGTFDPANYRNDVHALPLTGPPAWSLLTPTGTPPQPRRGAAAIYDPARDRLVLFGGADLNDAWRLSLAGTPAWSPISASGTARYYDDPSAVLDAARDRMVVFGKESGDLYTESITALSLGSTPTWTVVTPTGALPPAVFRHGAVYDADEDRMLVVGGTYWVPPGVTAENHSTYAYHFAGTPWIHTYATPRDGGAVTRSSTSNCYDAGSAVTLRAVPGPGFVFDHWVGDAAGAVNPLTVMLTSNLSIGAAFVPGVVAAAIERFEASREADGVHLSWAIGTGTDVRDARVERAEHEAGPWSAIAASSIDRDGGSVAIDTDASPAETWYYRLTLTLSNGSLVRSPIVRVAGRGDIARTELALVAPNPGSLVRIEYTLARQTPVRLSVMDIGGREVAVLAQGVHAAGRYSAAFGAGGGSPVAPGVYFLKLFTTERTETRRIAIVH